jgi:hypothetical protein
MVRLPSKGSLPNPETHSLQVLDVPGGLLKGLQLILRKLEVEIPGLNVLEQELDLTQEQ